MTHIPIPSGLLEFIIVASVMPVLSNEVIANASWTVGGGEILQDGNE